ncbi:hypothetical protein ES702_06883 [subsurface metagenome]
MPTQLGPTYSLDWRGDPPHMLKPDVPVWYRFLEKYGTPIVNLYYDSFLGGPFLTDQEKKDPLKRDWQYLLSKRADAICELTDEVWIVEVAAEPGIRALGQLQTYRALWLRDPKMAKIERLILVGERIDPDLIDAAGTYGLQVFLV